MVVCILSSLLILSNSLPSVLTRAAFATTRGLTTAIATTTARTNMRNNISSSGFAAPEAPNKNLVVDPFCFRQFREHPDKNVGYTGTIFDISMTEFEDIVNQRYDERLLQPGYAPFCKHLFVVNDFTDAVTNVLRITPNNEHLLRTKYEARNQQELPVLQRYFPKQLLEQDPNFPNRLPKAKYLDLILYSREQINAETAARQQDDEESSTTAISIETTPWGIVSIKAQDTDTELPMNPITNMRNALGKEHGGSGIPIDRHAYMEAVEYWKDHAVIT